METRYQQIIRTNLSRFFAGLPPEPEASLGAERVPEGFSLRAFGTECVIGPDQVWMDGTPVWDPPALLLSLYALNARPDPLKPEPFTAFRELPNSAPYHGAFAANTERILVPHVPLIEQQKGDITRGFDVLDQETEGYGDFSFVLLPLPKVALQYIFYLPDEEFAASATTLFSANALSFMPLDGLADVGEYTSKALLRFIGR